MAFSDFLSGIENDVSSWYHNLINSHPSSPTPVIQKPVGPSLTNIFGAGKTTAPAPVQQPKQTFAVGEGMGPGPTVAKAQAVATIKNQPVQPPTPMSLPDSVISAFPRAVAKTLLTAETAGTLQHPGGPAAQTSYTAPKGSFLESLLMTNKEPINAFAVPSGATPTQQKVAAQIQPSTVQAQGQQFGKELGFGKTGQTTFGTGAVALGIADLFPVFGSAEGAVEKATAKKLTESLGEDIAKNVIKHGTEDLAQAILKGGENSDLALKQVLDKASKTAELGQNSYLKFLNGEQLNPGEQFLAHHWQQTQIEASQGAKAAEETLNTASGLGKAGKILQAGQEAITAENKVPLSTKFQKFVTEAVDRLTPVGNLMKDAEKELGRKLTLDENGYIAGRLYAGSGGMIQNRLNQLSEVLKPAKDLIESGDLSSYLFSQRAAERAERGFKNPGGFSAEDAAQTVMDLKAKLGNEGWARLQSAADGIKGYADNLLAYMHDNGMISDKAYEAIKANNQNYVPFDVIEHMIDQGEHIPHGARAFSMSQQSVVKALQGTTKLVDDPINALVRKTIKTVDAVERNRVAQTLSTLRGQLGEVGDKLIRPIAADEYIPKGWDKVSFYEDGVKKAVIVKQDVADALKGLSAKQADFLTRSMSVWSNVLRRGATSANIAFMIPNMIRDATTATLVAKHGFNPMDWGRGAWEAIKSIGSEMGLQVNDQIYQNYLRDAGAIGGYYSTWLNDVPRTVDDLTKPAWREFAGLLNPMNTIEKIGELSERSTRLGVYMKALAKGEEPRMAGFLSREATVDFAKSGDAGKIMNMWIPFVNAKLQGTLNIAKSLKEAGGNPARMAELTAKIGSLGVLPFIASYESNRKNFPDVWNDIADFDKANNMIFIYGNGKDEQGRYNQVIKIPKGELAYFIDPVQDLLEYAHNKDENFGTVMQNILVDTGINVLPVSATRQSSVGRTLGQVAAQTLMPPPVKAVAQNLANYDYFKMRPRKTPDEMAATPTEQYKPYTPYLAKKIGDITGTSPIDITNAVKDIAAGAGAQALGIYGTVEKPGLTLPSGGALDRFTTAYGGQEALSKGTNLQPYLESQADYNLINKRAAEGAWKAIQNATSQEEVDKIMDTVKGNEAVMKKLKALAKNEAEGIDYTDQQILHLSPPVRAQYLMDQLNSAETQEELEQMVSEFKDKGFMTADTIAALTSAQ